MKPIISKISTISENQSVVCIIGDGKIPDNLMLSEAEKDFAEKKLSKNDNYVYLNSCGRCIYIVKQKEGLSHFKVREEIRKEASNLKKLILSNNHSELVIMSFSAYNEAIEDFAERFILSVYSFDKYKTRSDDLNENAPPKLLLLGDIADENIKWLDDITSAVYFALDMVNEPVNRLNAALFAEEAQKLGNFSGFNVEILTKGKIEALKMGGLLAVNKGSVDPPLFVILEWKPAGHLNKNPFALVGKGIMYDTGGLNIKTGDYMAGMHGDMAGAAIVAGVMSVIAKNNVPLHVVGLLPLTDNRPGGNAFAQGDIITMHNGMTVEIGNTDAEGRLILADAISYASKYSPELIINIATLTGSASMTFSNKAIALMTNAGRKYVNLIAECGDDVHERISELPLWEEYGEMLKSEVADINNVGKGREAGAILAGKFLEKFAEFPLIHLDIAGMSMLKDNNFYKTVNSSGLRLLAAFLKKMAEDNNYPPSEGAGGRTKPINN
jgi:leucyl aminopeptidase